MTIHQHRYSDVNVFVLEHGPQVPEVLFVHCAPLPHPREEVMDTALAVGLQDGGESHPSSIATVLTLPCKAFLTPHFGPASSEQGADPLSPGCLAVNICNPTAGQCHLVEGGRVQHATDGQLGHPLELPVRRK